MWSSAHPTISEFRYCKYHRIIWLFKTIKKLGKDVVKYKGFHSEKLKLLHILNMNMRWIMEWKWEDKFLWVNDDINTFNFIVGAQPSFSFISVLSELRPRTPSGPGMWWIGIFLFSKPRIISAISFMLTISSLPIFTGSRKSDFVNLNTTINPNVKFYQRLWRKRWNISIISLYTHEYHIDFPLFNQIRQILNHVNAEIYIVAI